ncbi:MAG TPA: 23S rRNA (pseudouridine(1915)-N(3))-methyltransferase RlmH [Bacteroidia bacterium]|nr:23S rRNA (pseudouridine(1915)-N(3))-methyltransferase RlmH [Bacteroidia bacterium]
MKIKLIVIGKTSEPYLREGIEVYLRRLIRYCDFELEVLPDVRNKAVLPVEKLKTAEAQLVLKKLEGTDYVVLLDDKGKQFKSEGLAEFVTKRLASGRGRLVFVVGGAFGFDNGLYERADIKLSLSMMTFSHQMVRLIFLEQLYRAFTIIKNEPYHHS